MDELNPYAPPPQPTREVGAPVDVRSLTQPPAICLVVTSAMWAMYLLLATLVQTPRVIVLLQEESWQFALPQVIGAYIPLPWILFVLWGSIQMLRMRSYRWARVAAWLALAPACGPCGLLGIPLGIWAIVVLRRPQVRAAFSN